MEHVQNGMLRPVPAGGDIFLGSLCCVFLLSFGDWIGVFLFHSPLAGKFITAMSWLCPFLYTNAATDLVQAVEGRGYLTENKPGDGHDDSGIASLSHGDLADYVYREDPHRIFCRA